MLVLRCLLLGLALLASGCVSSAFSGANVVYRHKYVQDDVCDYSIRIAGWNALRKKFSQEILKPVHFTIYHKIVLLTGQVPSEDVRTQIEQTIKCNTKVSRLYNALSVGAPATTSQQLHDSWITTKIKSKIIASNELYADKIKVVTEQNIVYLVGIVTESEGQCATEIAKRTEGVEHVVTFFFYMTMPEI